MSDLPTPPGKALATAWGSRGPVVLGLALAAAGRLSAESSVVVEWHRTSFWPFLSRWLQALSGPSAVTVGEGLCAVGVVWGVIEVFVRPRRALPWLVFVAGLGVFGFYVSWGFSYKYPPLGARLAPVAAAAVAGPEARSRLVALAEAAARLVERAAEADPDFSDRLNPFLDRIGRGLEGGYKHLPASLAAAPVSDIGFGPVKPSRVSFAMSRLGISGYYFPWTGEAQINTEMARTQWPRVAAHEKAHQRGFARENEASVIGVLACLSSSDPAVFYSGTMGLFAAFDREMARVDRKALGRIWATLPGRVVRDFQTEAAFWKAHEGPAAELGEKVNDTYLKVQGVKTGVASYGETTRLFLQALETKSLVLGSLLQPAGAATAR